MAQQKKEARQAQQKKLQKSAKPLVKEIGNREAAKEKGKPHKHTPSGSCCD